MTTHVIRLVVVLAAAGVAACESSSSPAAPGAALAFVSGRVYDGSNVPVAGVLVTATDAFLGVVHSRTDDGGNYALTIDARNSSVVLTAERDDFEPSLRPLGGPTGSLERTQIADIRLHAIARIQVGDSMPLRVQTDDPACRTGPSLLDLRPCRRVRIGSSAGGRVFAGAVDDLGDFSAVRSIAVQQADKPPASEGLVIEVAAGSETIVEYILTGQNSSSFLVISGFVNE